MENKQIAAIREALEAYDKAFRDFKQDDRTADVFLGADLDLTEALSTDAIRSLLAALDEAQKDAKRYRWLRDEAWAGYNQGKGKPHVFTIDGAGNRKTMLAEEALDSEVDAAIAAQECKKISKSC